MRFFSPFLPLLKGWLISLFAFGLLAGFFIGGFARFVSLPVAEAFWYGARDWLPWAILTPLLFRLSSRIPLGRGQWKLSLPVHIGAAIVAMAFCVGWGDLIAT